MKNFVAFFLSSIFCVSLTGAWARPSQSAEYRRFYADAGVAPTSASNGETSTITQAMACVVPADKIRVTVSSIYSDGQNPQHLIDGSGMDGAKHDNADDASTMWHTIYHPDAAPPASGLPDSPAWARFDFAAPLMIERVLIWNHNQANLTDRGFCTIGIYGSSDGTHWFPLTREPVVVLPKASGEPGELPDIVPNVLAGRPVKSVMIEAEEPGGNYGGTAYGLSAVRFAVHRMPEVLSSEGITVSASSTYSGDQSPTHLIDGSGMIGALHDNDGGASTMWHTVDNPVATSPGQGLPASPAWVRFDFDQQTGFPAILVWNHNQEKLADRGFCMTRIVGSSDGVHWHALTSTPLIQLQRAPGDAYSLPVRIATPGAEEHPVTSVIIAADANNGNDGGTCYGLSAVRFVITR